MFCCAESTVITYSIAVASGIGISAISLFSGFVAIICDHMMLCLLVHLAILLKWIHDSHAFCKARLGHCVINLLFI